ncbi:ABC transporter permease [Pseudogemmobacter faecipullorum]|uniref:ABC transporter permease n=1 Tax=Pseudogemmobacter faecipullorum TaxID=2755041 RepID=A0ABS8CLX4_9RHOB|nr:ABC transporter permease [Pseudogemmobacter faecipullorum]MCB5410392.1 ABC transporter permease [Pseudogemmobacter faecipullorum]
MNELFTRFGKPLGSCFLVLVALWLGLLVLVPNLTMLDFALRPSLPPAQTGGEKDVYSLTHFAYLAGHATHRQIFLKTLVSSALVTLVTLILCYPLAWWLGQSKQPRRLVMVLLLVPYLMNEVLRGLAWYIILAFSGPLNQLLLQLGLISGPVRWYGDGGVLAGMAYAYILFMLFPITNAMSTLDGTQIEAARDMGAGRLRIHWRIVLPHARVGIATGCVFTFILSAGSYMAPALLGAPGSRWFTQLVYDWFFENGNWNRGAAYGLTLLVLCLLVVLCLLRLFRVNLASAVR